MSEYERFTERVDSGFVSELDCRIAYNKLCALEDKIDNGTLIELPCKVGDKVYKICPQSKYIQFGQYWDGIKVEHPCQKCGWQHCSCYDIGFQKDWDNIVQEREMKSLEYIVKIIPYLGTIWFTTKAEAEAKLRELKGE